MSGPKKRKVQMIVDRSEVPALLAEVAESMKEGVVRLAGKEVPAEEFENFAVSFKQTKDGLRMMVKVKYVNPDGSVSEGDED